MKFRSLMTAICVLATAHIVSAAPFAYIANSGTKNVTVIDTALDTIVTTVALPDDNGATLPDPYAYSVAVSASGQYAYIGLQDTNEVTVIDTATNSVAKRISLGTDSPGGLAVNAAETRLYVASNKSNTLIVIDITGSGATEVGRVTVDTSSISNPEGVVLSPDGLKAYVANSTQGSIAEISLDETNNIYTRTDLISLGNNTSPMGLAINSAGSKLYAASLNGTASVVNLTATPRTVTDISVDSGQNVSITANDPYKIYAPSVYDGVYTVNGDDNAVSGPYSVIGQPWGSSLVPGDTKLYVAMYTANSVKVFNTGLNTVDATITLPDGAKPTSTGDFIGPDFPYTITSTNGANCTISPLGAIPVNSYGRSFSISGTGTCDVKVDGVSVGSPSVYSFTNVSAGHTIDASELAGTYYTLSGDWISSVGGWLVSNPGGINQLSKSAQFASGSSVTLSVGDSANHQVQAGSWTGSCIGQGATCTLTMDGNKTFGAVIIAKPTGTGPLFNSTKSSYHQTLADATASAASGNIIKIANTYTLGGSTDSLSSNVTVTLSGNWDAGFSTQSGSVSMGALTITAVAVIADNLTL